MIFLAPTGIPTGVSGEVAPLLVSELRLEEEADEVECARGCFCCQVCSCCLKQCAQVREGTGARGLKLASWSRGMAYEECQSQKMLPQHRQ